MMATLLETHSHHKVFTTQEIRKPAGNQKGKLSSQRDSFLRTLELINCLKVF